MNIIVTNQSEMDNIDVNICDFIEIRTESSITISKRYIYFVSVYGNSKVVARKNSIVMACDNSTVMAYDNSTVVARENSRVEAWVNSKVEAYGNSKVVARKNSTVMAYDNSTVMAYDNSTVVARENSRVVARDNSRVNASHNVQVLNYQITDDNISISGNARIVYNPRTVTEYINTYNLPHTKNDARFYKAVHKIDGRYFSDYDRNFEYIIGETIKADSLDDNISNVCSHGIHMSYLQWALNYGRKWNDLAILEVSARIDEVLIPSESDKVRAPKVKVIREVPLEECSLLGKFIARNKEN